MKKSEVENKEAKATLVANADLIQGISIGVIPEPDNANLVAVKEAAKLLGVEMDQLDFYCRENNWFA